MRLRGSRAEDNGYSTSSLWRHYSIALAYWLRPTVAFTVDYGQLPAQAEIRASAQICRELSIPLVIRVDCSGLGLGGLTTRPGVEISPTVEWWPFRNQLLVTLAGTKMIGLELYGYQLHLEASLLT